MKAIVLLTDFSENAEHAADCALLLAGKMNAELILFHVYPDMPAISRYAAGSYYGEDSEYWHRQSELQLEALRKRLNSRCTELNLETLMMHTQSAEGDLGNELSNLLKTQPSAFVVMGSRTDCALARFFNGSETRSVIECATCPVWIVPPKARLQHIHKLILATDFEAEELKTVHKLLRICKIFQAQLEVVHVMQNGNHHNSAKSTFLKQLGHINSSLVSYKEIRGKEVVNRLNRICRQTRADALAIVHHQENFLRRMFCHSMTDEALTNQKVPLLVFPVSVTGQP